MVRTTRAAVAVGLAACRLLTGGAAEAAEPTVVDVLRAARAEDRRVLCEVLKDDPDCAASPPASRDENLRIACPGLARMYVERTTYERAFAAADGSAVLMTDAPKFLSGACSGYGPMLDGLAERVDHGELWSVVAFAEVAALVPEHAAASCAAWAEVVTKWPTDPDDLVGGLHLAEVARCGDDATIRAVFGRRIDTATGQAYLGLALFHSGRRAEACEAFRRGAKRDPRAYAGNIHDTNEYGARRACD